jgi:hypothetical protein
VLALCFLQEHHMGLIDQFNADRRGQPGFFGYRRQLFLYQPGTRGTRIMPADPGALVPEVFDVACACCPGGWQDKAHDAGHHAERLRALGWRTRRAPLPRSAFCEPILRRDGAPTPNALEWICPSCVWASDHPPQFTKAAAEFMALAGVRAPNCLPPGLHLREQVR